MAAVESFKEAILVKMGDAFVASCTSRPGLGIARLRGNLALFDLPSQHHRAPSTMRGFRRPNAPLHPILSSAAGSDGEDVQ
jgi:hypothetical protein